MATDKPTLSHARIQSHELAAVHAWVSLKAACGHSLRFFDDGPASLPTEPTTPVSPVLAGSVGVAL